LGCFVYSELNHGFCGLAGCKCSWSFIWGEASIC